jgi:hypothetical protein
MSASREGQQQDAVRINAVDDQVGNPVGEGLGLTRARARNHKHSGGANPRVPVLKLKVLSLSPTLAGRDLTCCRL